MTDEEIRARAAEIARGLDALDDMGDEEEQRQTLDALMKAIDEEPLVYPQAIPAVSDPSPRGGACRSHRATSS
jgi:hypothetical protein